MKKLREKEKASQSKYRYFSLRVPFIPVYLVYVCIFSSMANNHAVYDSVEGGGGGVLIYCLP